MKAIYREARLVIGWLGSDDNGGSQGLDILTKMVGMAERNKKDWLHKNAGAV
jgi:hypothetical protein